MRSRGRVRRAVATLAVAGALAAVSTPAVAGRSAPAHAVTVALPRTTPDTTVVPPPTLPPTTAAPTPPTTPADGQGGDDDTDWWPIVVALALGVALVALLLAFSGRRHPPARSSIGARRTVPSARVPTAQSTLLTTAQWIHDQLTIELLASAPSAAAARWATERSRLDNVAIGAQQQWVAGAGDSWQSLARMVSLLATSLDTNISLRNQVPSDPRLIDESTEVVERHRRTLQQLVTAMWPLADR